ncbi:MAG: competence protein ComE [Gammaproteobacteria bacterium]|nr:MAG: competence protein ComE [Gammaproteobacteria bacterium]
MKKLTLTLFFVFFFAVLALAKVNINTATVEELSTLQGIGPVKAEAIVKYRKEVGKFKTVEDIIKVDGIGEKMLEKVKQEIIVK